MGEHEAEYPWLTHFSLAVGYMYTVAWGVSFLGQIHLNWKLKNVKGCNFDFVVYNVTGFSFYAAYNTAAFIDEKKYDGTKFGIGGVQVNDIVFAYWSLAMTIITLAQCIYYPKGQNKVTRLCIDATVGYWIFIIFYIFFEYVFNAFTVNSEYANAFYMMSYVKIWISLTKYVPQAWMNYKRKSTVGWSIFNIFLDFTGGSLSFLQMALDAINEGSSPFQGGSQGLNIVKFALSVISMVFDVLFMIQHYLLYPQKQPQDSLNSELLQEEGEIENDADYAKKTKQVSAYSNDENEA